MVPFHDFLALAPSDREGKVPFIHTVNGNKLGRLLVSKEMVALAEDRSLFWSQLRQLAGLEIPEGVRERIASTLQSDYEQRAARLRAEYESQLADLQANYAHSVARRLAETLIRVSEGRTVGDVVADALSAPEAAPLAAAATPVVAAAAASKPVVAAAVTVAAPLATAPPPTAAPVQPGDDAMVMEPYIESELCTSCNECTNISKKLFSYNDNKQSYIKDSRGGTFQQLVRAAELCPVRAIHPGTPLNPHEKDLDKWVARAAALN